MFAILSALGEAAVRSVDIFDVIASAGYGASLGRLQYEVAKRERDRERRAAALETLRCERQRYYNVLAYLKRDGIVRDEVREGARWLAVTRKGAAKLAALREQKRAALPVRPYESERGSALIIVIFDIPEKEKRKRRWLRETLRELGLTMLQKSVWGGKVKLPKAFIDDLRELKLLACVEIFEVSRGGSITHLA